MASPIYQCALVVNMLQQEEPCSTEAPLEHITLVTKRIPEDVSYIRPLNQDCEMQPTHLIHTNKNRKFGKMRQQSSMFQMKKQDNPPVEELSKVEIINLPNKEFRLMIMKTLKELGNRMEKCSESLIEN